ncbi:hypothetical protein [Kordia sp.]|uniref:hypothetical protein n=1 Tax=Kordia sp. TaxID=1965332 RepID=UPI0025C3912E|nr:hypothetical protein [Kordia sp.]MCH2196494.1 hypothetical protein [Kordia sp.]
MLGIDNEKLLLESTNRQLRLTTHRLRYYETNKANSDFTSIMLYKISSVQLAYYKSNIWFSIIGIATIPVVEGIILIILYYMSKKHVVCVTPDGGNPIIFETRGIKRYF